ncbi:hypothetical protein KR026_008948 [Drosophila bipectinata]|nr:hypothetical protein KR026_008948 [Drosophila bipectinata]
MPPHLSIRSSRSEQAQTLKIMGDLCRRRSHAGDVVSEEEEDPRRRGILRNTSCRQHRERLRSTRQTHILQGLTVLAAAIIVLALLLFLALEMAQESVESDPVQVVGKQPPQQKKSFWTDVLRFLGIKQQQLGGQSSLGKVSCSLKALDMERIFRQVGRHVLNQEQALARMERALSEKKGFRSVALVGPPGVGKTLTTTVLRQEFPWPANAHAYSWSTKMADEVGKFRMLRQFVDGLSDCGANLLIIDNLSTCDHSLVPIFNRLILEREGDLSKHNQTVLVIYVINVKPDQYWEQYELLQQLESDTTIVSFRFFSTDDVLDCLDRELKVQKLFMSPERQALIVEDAVSNVFERGCKDLRLQILRNGVPDP